MSDSASVDIVTDGVILLRPLTVSDAEAHLAGEDDEQRKWFGHLEQASWLEGVIQFIERSQFEWTSAGRRNWGIREVETGALVGNVEARNRGDGSANISVAVFPNYRRRAVRMACAYARDALSVGRVVAIIDAENFASRRVAENVGFLLDGPAEAWEDDLPTGEMLRYVLLFE